MKDNIKKYKSYIIIAVVVLLIIAVGFTVAYFQAQVGSGATANVTVTTKTTDVLTFSKGNDISITATQANFYNGAGNLNGSTTATATLLADNDTNSATQNYNVYFNITGNNFEYTTAPTNTPELLLTVTNPSNQAVTSISGLTYTTVNGVSGFDITTQRGLIQIASNYSITSSSSSTATNQTWNFTVTLVNLNSDQEANTGKYMTAKAVIQKDTITTAYWNAGFPNYDVAYTYSYPLGQKVLLTDYWDYINGVTQNITWTSGSPTTYTTMAQLQSNYANFSTNPMYIKTTTEHQACLYYNNHEFCFGANYWEGTIGVSNYASALATKNKLQAEMESALGTSATSCSSYDVFAYCYFGDFSCYADSGGRVNCYSGVSRAYCEVYPDGPADCYVD